MEESLLKTPGHVLRNAREAKNLSQTEVANRLRLALHVIKALEADDYAAFAASVYVRGYLRAYAALLESDSEPLLSSFDLLTAETSIDHPLNSHYVPSNITRIGYLHQSKRRFARGLSWVIAVFLIILLGIWWYGQHHRKHVDMSIGLLAPTPHVSESHTIPPPKSKPATTAPTASSPVVAAPSSTVPAPASVLTPALEPAPVVVAPVGSSTPIPASVAKKSNGFHETFILESKKQ